MAKLFYKPFGIVAGLIAGKLAQQLFNVIWAKLDPEGEEKGPQPKLRETSPAKAVAGTALQAATFAGTRAVVDRASLRTFEHLTGAWAGDKPPKPVDEPARGVPEGGQFSRPQAGPPA